MNDAITVTVTGSRVHCGATTVAAVITKALADAGFDNVKCHNLDGDLDVIAHKVNQGVLPAEEVKKRRVIICDIGSSPSSCRDANQSPQPLETTDEQH